MFRKTSALHAQLRTTARFHMQLERSVRRSANSMKIDGATGSLLVRPGLHLSVQPCAFGPHGAQGRVKAGRFSAPQGLVLTGRAPCYDEDGRCRSLAWSRARSCFVAEAIVTVRAETRGFHTGLGGAASPRRVIERGRRHFGEEPPGVCAPVNAAGPRLVPATDLPTSLAASFNQPTCDALSRRASFVARDRF